jgi:hypothetical protein
MTMRLQISSEVRDARVSAVGLDERVVDTLALVVYSQDITAR